MKRSISFISLHLLFFVCLVRSFPSPEVLNNIESKGVSHLNLQQRNLIRNSSPSSSSGLNGVSSTEVENSDLHEFDLLVYNVQLFAKQIFGLELIIFIIICSSILIVLISIGVCCCCKKCSCCKKCHLKCCSCGMLSCKLCPDKKVEGKREENEKLKRGTIIVPSNMKNDSGEGVLISGNSKSSGSKSEIQSLITKKNSESLSERKRKREEKLIKANQIQKEWEEKQKKKNDRKETERKKEKKLKEEKELKENKKESGAITPQLMVEESTDQIDEYFNNDNGEDRNGGGNQYLSGETNEDDNYYNEYYENEEYNKNHDENYDENYDEHYDEHNDKNGTNDNGEWDNSNGNQLHGDNGNYDENKNYYIEEEFEQQHGDYENHGDDDYNYYHQENHGIRRNNEHYDY